MRSVVYDRFGDPAEVLHLGERPLPEPGPGEIRVKLTLSPIHNHDLLTIRGEYGFKPALPAVGGSEAVGVVDAHGPDVSAPALGQRVTMAGVPDAWADYFTVPARGVVPVPDAVSDEIACQICAMPLSAIMALEDFELQPGQWMIQNAATGAVGKTLAMIAKARGIRVVNLVRREAGVAELAALGVGDAVSTSEDGWQAKVKAITGGAPIAAALNSVGGEEGGQLLHLLAEGGHLMVFGVMSGKPLVLNPGDLIFKQAKVTGFWAAKRFGDQAKVVRMIGDLLKMAATGELKLPVEKAFPLAEAADAARASAQPGRNGKIALRP